MQNSEVFTKSQKIEARCPPPTTSLLIGINIAEITHHKIANT